ncbi:MAG: restriction endonuclease subunit S [Pseudonocardiaceae bacterium]
MTDHRPFGDLLAYPLRSGVTVAADSRGTGIKMLNMGELFRYPRIPAIEMARVEVNVADPERVLLQPDDLMFARRSLTLEGAGKCSIVKEIDEATTWESSIIRARLDKRMAHPPYYFYYFESPIGRRAVETIVEQVAAAGIRLSELRKLRVPVPELAEQRAIAEVLGALDDKIAVNITIANTAEAVLAAEFAATGIDEEPENLDAAISLRNLVELNPAVSQPSEAEPVYVDMQKLPVSGMSITDWTTRPAKGGTRFENGDTLLARITPCLQNRKTGYVDFLNKGQVALGSTEYVVLRSRPHVPVELSYFLAISERFRSFAIRHMVGTSGRQRVSASDLAGFQLTSPVPSLLEAFGSKSRRLFALVKSQRDENRTLSGIRDALLPQLMSGKIRVKDAEKTVEEVL